VLLYGCNGFCGPFSEGVFVEIRGDIFLTLEPAEEDLAVIAGHCFEGEFDCDVDGEGELEEKED